MGAVYFCIGQAGRDGNSRRRLYKYSPLRADSTITLFSCKDNVYVL